MAINTITAPRTMSMEEMRAGSMTFRKPCPAPALTVVLMPADLIVTALFLGTSSWRQTHDWNSTVVHAVRGTVARRERAPSRPDAGRERALHRDRRRHQRARGRVRHRADRHQPMVDCRRT